MAKLRDTMTGGGPVLLKINMEAGHGGASGRFDFLKEIALDYAFALAVTNTVTGTSRARDPRRDRSGQSLQLPVHPPVGTLGGNNNDR